MDGIAMAEPASQGHWRRHLTGIIIAAGLLAGSLPTHGQTTVYAFTNFVGNPTSAGRADGTGAHAQFLNPVGVAADGAGNLYVTDSGTIRQVTPAGVVTTLAGSAATGYQDGVGKAARFGNPASIAVAPDGSLFVADSYSNYVIRKVTPAGTNSVVTTVAGKAGISGKTDGEGSAARFGNPNGIAVDAQGCLYVTDLGNRTIRKLTPIGTNWLVTTLAGQAGAYGTADGIGSAARFENLVGVASDNAGNLWVADEQATRKVTPAGVVTTFAGGGENNPAGLSYPSGVVVDDADAVFVINEGNNTILEITPDRVARTVAGTAGPSGSADGVGSAARFNQPRGIAVDRAGNLYVADTLNHRITKGTPAVVLQPPTLSSYFDGENLYLAWPADHLGWMLEARTNAIGIGTGTNWFPLPDSATNTEYMVGNPAGPAGLFRLRSP